MNFFLVGGLLIGLPAIVVVFLFMGSTMMFPALASLLIAALPFVLFAVLLRRTDDLTDDGH